MSRASKKVITNKNRWNRGKLWFQPFSVINFINRIRTPPFSVTKLLTPILRRWERRRGEEESSSETIKISSSLCLTRLFSPFDLYQRSRCESDMRKGTKANSTGAWYCRRFICGVSLRVSNLKRLWQWKKLGRLHDSSPS